MKHLLVLLMALVAGCAAVDGNACKVDPDLFCKHFEELDAEMPEDAKAELLALPKDQYIQMHFGLGMTVRNHFDLWGDNEITQFFRQNGVDHPDSMSIPFIGGFVEYLRGENVDMAKVIETYALPPPPPPQPSSSAQQK